MGHLRGASTDNGTERLNGLPFPSAQLEVDCNLKHVIWPTDNNDSFSLLSVKAEF